MKIAERVVLVTGGASGLGLASAQKLAQAGARVVIVDLPQSPGEAVAAALGSGARFAAADVTDEAQMRAALELAGQMGTLRAVVHCAGRGATLRVVDREGRAESQEIFDAIVRTNLSGSFNVLRLAAEHMAATEPEDDERGVIVLTASIAAFEGQIGQIPYAASKAGIVGMTLVAARDLAKRLIRVNTIAPGIFDTPILDRLPAEVKESLGKSVPHPARLGRASEFAMLAAHIIENPMINGETIRIDGGVRMQAR